MTPGAGCFLHARYGIIIQPFDAMTYEEAYQPLCAVDSSSFHGSATASSLPYVLKTTTSISTPYPSPPVTDTLTSCGPAPSSTGPIGPLDKKIFQPPPGTPPRRRVFWAVKWPTSSPSTVMATVSCGPARLSLLYRTLKE